MSKMHEEDLKLEKPLGAEPQAYTLEFRTEFYGTYSEALAYGETICHLTDVQLVTLFDENWEEV